MKLFEKSLDKGRRIGYYSEVLRVKPEGFYPAGWFSRLERRPVTPEVEGSSPFPVATYFAGSKFAAVAQSVERILGKDEVTSSNLVSSSRKSSFS